MRNAKIRNARGARAQIAARPSVYGIGFLALDVVRNDLRKESVYAYAGGTCGNVLAVLAYLGWDAYPIARLNGDAASKRVKDDLRDVGVMLDLTECIPTVNTPIVIHVIRQNAKGISRHRFEWACPLCGNTLPRFKPVPVRAVPKVAAKMVDPSVFFMDRVSRSSLELAKVAFERGALIYFEPSEITDPRMFRKALRLAHIVKYSSDRLRLLGVDGRRSNILLEIRTLGSRGLAYRSRASGNGAWIHLPAIPASIMKDTCGAGDWCSAGVIARLGATGLPGLLNAQPGDLTEALRYGQALAAWNCGFEGARGGMYRVKRSSFVRQVRAILGKVTSTDVDAGQSRPLRTSLVTSVVCPACPPSRAVDKRSRLSLVRSPGLEH